MKPIQVTLERCVISDVSDIIQLSCGKYKREIKVWYNGAHTYLLDHISDDPAQFHPIDTTACYHFRCYLNGILSPYGPINKLLIAAIYPLSNSNQNQ
jgi:hypothetical protein